jgi:polysaccharide chain length determinant protein (PEP-CTERM system associated)
MLRRRWWLIVGLAVVGLGIAYGISLLLPNLYTSQTLVLVEQQKVPDAFVKPIVTEELNQRLSTMQEQILSRTRLQPIIENSGLFAKERGKASMEDLIDQMRSMVKVTAVRADFAAGDHTGVPGFYVSFTAHDPRVAQQVCSRITSMFIDENLKAREQSALGTTDFLSGQVDAAKRDLDQKDAQLAAFKRQHIGQLPEQEQSNLSMLGSLNTQLDAVNQALTRGQQDKTYTNSLIAQQEQAWKSAQQTGGAQPETLQQQLDRMQSDLLVLESKYTPDHPDVQKQKAAIEQVRKQIGVDENTAPSASQDHASASTKNRVEPQPLQQLRLQAHLIDESIKGKIKEQQSLQREIATIQQRIQLTPTVEEQYKEITRDYNTALAFYNDLLVKKSQSQVSSDMERRQQGEQFQIMDAANLPEKPTSPNRQLFAGGGLAGGLVLGLGIALLLELLDSSLYNDEDVTRYLELPTVIMIPDLNAEAKRLEREHKMANHRSATAVVGG